MKWSDIERGMRFVHLGSGKGAIVIGKYKSKTYDGVYLKRDDRPDHRLPLSTRTLNRHWRNVVRIEKQKGFL